MIYRGITDRWVKQNKNKILNKLDTEYLTDRYTDNDLLDVISKFEYYESPYYIGTSLYYSIMKLVTPFFKDKSTSFRLIDRQVNQIILFCKLGEYGIGYFSEDTFDEILSEVIDEIESGE